MLNFLRSQGTLIWRDTCCISLETATYYTDDAVILGDSCFPKWYHFMDSHAMPLIPALVLEVTVIVTVSNTHMCISDYSLHTMKTNMPQICLHVLSFTCC